MSLFPLKRWRHDANFKAHEVYIAHVIVCLLLLGLFAGAWDIWWHMAIGRTTFFIPPHLVIYFSIGSSIVMAAYGWLKTREVLWRHLAFFLFVVPFLGPIDEWWHWMFGVENLSTPFILWSPPHLALILVYIAALILVHPLIAHDRNMVSRRFFEAFSLAAIYGLLLLIVSPIEPLGPYHVFGWWGAAFEGFVIALSLVAAQRLIGGTGVATMVTAFLLPLYVITSDNVPLAAGILMPAYHLPGLWIQIGAFLFAAIVADVLAPIHAVIRSALAVGAWGIFYYGIETLFRAKEFSYTTTEMEIGIIAAIAGGVLGALIAPRLLRRLFGK